MGGMGNQLWIVAAAYSIQQESNKQNDYKIDIVLPELTENPHKVSELDYYDIFFKKICAGRVAIPPDFLKGSMEFMELARQIGLPYYSPQKVSHDYWSVMNPPPSSFLLEGYFQNYPAIEKYIPELVEKYREGLREHIFKDPSIHRVGIHVRRGDYMKNTDYHYILDNKYYEKALQQFIGEETEFLVFSDDPIGDALPALHNLPRWTTTDEVATFAAMTSCKGGFIIANSTFSWWAAMLADSRKVVAPLRWSAQNPRREDLFPKSWICF